MQIIQITTVVVPETIITASGYQTSQYVQKLYGLSSDGKLYKWDRKWISRIDTNKDGDTVDDGEYIQGWKLLVDEFNK